MNEIRNRIQGGFAALAVAALIASCAESSGGAERDVVDDGGAGDDSSVTDTDDGGQTEDSDAGEPDLQADVDDSGGLADADAGAGDLGGEDAAGDGSLADVDDEEPVEGEVCDNGADDDDDGRADCHDSDCWDLAVCEGVPPAPWIRPRLWQPTWSDEFNGPEPGNEACYDNAVTPPQCLTIYWHNETCPERALDELADLNKCDWSVFYLYNWMDWGKPLGEGMNNFDPEMVTVTGGELILRANASLPDGGLSSGWSIQQVMDQYDCGNPPAEGFELSKDCPIISGGLWSKQMGAVTGLLQMYGRFEVRARLPVGPGSWPAHWMLPQEGPWPGAGEIDIMEATNHQPNFRPHEVAANFHDGVDIEVDGETHATHMSVGAMSQDMSIAQQTGEYHVFSAEWDAQELRFYVDELAIGTVVDGTLLPNRDMVTGDDVGDYPVDVPDRLFHMILNSTVTAFADDDYPDPRGFSPQAHYIDYVRAWELCEPSEDACPNGGAWDGANCRVGALPDRSDWFIYDDDLVYPAELGETDCPSGGEREGDLCVVYPIEAAVHTFASGSSFYIQSACLAATLSESPRCYSPCGGLGAFEGERCLVGRPPEGERGRVVGERFTYSFVDGEERCPIGRDRGTYCEFGEIPEGRTGWVPFDADAFYLNPICNPADYLPNCPEPCPAGTRWDGSRCFVANAPPGNSPFVWEGGLYYSYLDAGTYATKCPIGADDGAHCYLGPAPSSGPAVAGDSFTVAAACGTVPRLED